MRGGQSCRALLDGGVPASGITVLVATGLHRPNEGAELTELVGDAWVEETVTCVNHFARNDDDHVHVGTTSRGTVVRLDKRFVEADIRIATGLVEPHFMAGYSGGRKVIAPGIAHAETITTFHSARFMEDPKAVRDSPPQTHHPPTRHTHTTLLPPPQPLLPLPPSSPFACP